MKKPKQSIFFFLGVIGLTDLTGTYGGIILGPSGKSGSYHSAGEPPQWLTEPPLQVRAWLTFCKNNKSERRIQKYFSESPKNQNKYYALLTLPSEKPIWFENCLVLNIMCNAKLTQIFKGLSNAKIVL